MSSVLCSKRVFLIRTDQLRNDILDLLLFRPSVVHNCQSVWCLQPTTFPTNTLPALFVNNNSISAIFSTLMYPRRQYQVDISSWSLMYHSLLLFLQKLLFLPWRLSFPCSKFRFNHFFYVCSISTHVYNHSEAVFSKKVFAPKAHKVMKLGENVWCMFVCQRRLRNDRMEV